MNFDELTRELSSPGSLEYDDLEYEGFGVSQVRHDIAQALGLIPLGRGGDRVVYSLGDGTVIKIPRRESGVYANEREDIIWREFPSVRERLVEVMGVGHGGILRMRQVKPLGIDGYYKNTPYWVINDMRKELSDVYDSLGWDLSVDLHFNNLSWDLRILDYAGC